MSSKIVNDTMDAWDWDTVRDLLFAKKPFLTKDELGKKHGVRNYHTCNLMKLLL